MDSVGKNNEKWSYHTGNDLRELGATQVRVLLRPQRVPSKTSTAIAEEDLSYAARVSIEMTCVGYAQTAKLSFAQVRHQDLKSLGRDTTPARLNILL